MKKHMASVEKPISAKDHPRWNLALISVLLAFSGAISAVIIGSQDLDLSEYSSIVRDISTQSGLSSNLLHDLYLKFNPSQDTSAIPIGDITSIVEYIHKDDATNSTVIPPPTKEIIAVEEEEPAHVEEEAPAHVATAAPARADADGANSQVDLIAWMMEHGAVFNNIELVKYEGAVDHRGIHAKTDILPGDVIISVPEKFVITRQTALASPLIQELLKTVPSYNLRDHAHLPIAIYLVHERSLGASSFWHKYIESLPKQFENMPTNYNDAEMKLAVDSRLGTMSQSDIEMFKDDYQVICQAIPQFCQVNSFDLYKWGRLAVRSRSFSLMVDGIDESAMMPFADMVNHDFDNLASWRFQDDIRHGQIFCRRTISAGTPVTITYGVKSNRVLLRTYGFAVLNNPYNTANLYVQLPDGESASGMLRRRVAKTGNPDTEFYRILHQVSLDTADDEFKNAMALSRVATATPEELEKITDFGMSPITLNNEANALRHMEYSIDSALYKIGQHDEQDEALLHSSSLSTNERNILVTRYTERETLMKLSTLIGDFLYLMDPSISMSEFTRRRYNARYADHIGYVRQIVELRRSMSY